MHFKIKAVEYGPEYIAWLLDGRVYQNISAKSTSHSGHQHAEFFNVPYYVGLLLYH